MVYAPARFPHPNDSIQNTRKSSHPSPVTSVAPETLDQDACKTGQFDANPRQKRHFVYQTAPKGSHLQLPELRLTTIPTKSWFVWRISQPSAPPLQTPPAAHRFRRSYDTHRI